MVAKKDRAEELRVRREPSPAKARVSLADRTKRKAFDLFILLRSIRSSLCDLLTIGLVAHFIHRSFFDLLLRHTLIVLVTFQTHSYVQWELVSVCVYACAQLAQLATAMIFLYKESYASSSSHPINGEFFIILALIGQLASFAVLGIIQFTFNMSFWDHYLPLNEDYRAAWYSFVAEIVFTVIAIAYRYLKYYDIVKYTLPCLVAVAEANN